MEAIREQPVISVQNISMHFQVPLERPDSLKEYLIRTVKRQNPCRILKALDHVSFDVWPKEV